MKKIKLIAPILGASALVGALAPLAGCSCTTSTDREVEVDDKTKATIEVTKTTSGDIECKVKAKDDTKEVDKVSVTIGGKALKDDEFTFDKSTGKITIKKEVLDKHAGKIIVSPTVKTKPSISQITSAKYSGPTTTDLALLKSEYLKVTASFDDTSSRDLNANEYKVFYDGNDITSDVKGKGFAMSKAETYAFVIKAAKDETKTFNLSIKIAAPELVAITSATYSGGTTTEDAILKSDNLTVMGKYGTYEPTKLSAGDYTVWNEGADITETVKGSGFEMNKAQKYTFVIKSVSKTELTKDLTIDVKQPTIKSIEKVTYSGSTIPTTAVLKTDNLKVEALFGTKTTRDLTADEYTVWYNGTDITSTVKGSGYAMNKEDIYLFTIKSVADTKLIKELSITIKAEVISEITNVTYSGDTTYDLAALKTSNLTVKGKFGESTRDLNAGEYTVWNEGVNITDQVQSTNGYRMDTADEYTFTIKAKANESITKDLKITVTEAEITAITSVNYTGSTKCGEAKLKTEFLKVFARFGVEGTDSRELTADEYTVWNGDTNITDQVKSDDGYEFTEAKDYTLTFKSVAKTSVTYDATITIDLGDVTELTEVKYTGESTFDKANVNKSTLEFWVKRNGTTEPVLFPFQTENVTYTFKIGDIDISSQVLSEDGYTFDNAGDYNIQITMTLAEGFLGGQSFYYSLDIEITQPELIEITSATYSGEKTTDLAILKYDNLEVKGMLGTYPSPKKLAIASDYNVKLKNDDGSYTDITNQVMTYEGYSMSTIKTYNFRAVSANDDNVYFDFSIEVTKPAIAEISTVTYSGETTPEEAVLDPSTLTVMAKYGTYTEEEKLTIGTDYTVWGDTGAGAIGDITSDVIAGYTMNEEKTYEFTIKSVEKPGDVYKKLEIVISKPTTEAKITRVEYLGSDYSVVEPKLKSSLLNVYVQETEGAMEHTVDLADCTFYVKDGEDITESVKGDGYDISNPNTYTFEVWYKPTGATTTLKKDFEITINSELPDEPTSTQNWLAYDVKSKSKITLNFGDSGKTIYKYIYAKIETERVDVISFITSSIKNESIFTKDEGSNYWKINGGSGLAKKYFGYITFTFSEEFTGTIYISTINS